MKPKVFITRIAIFFVIAVISIFNIKNLNGQAANPTAPAATENSADSSDFVGWRITDYQPYIKSLKELEKLNKEYSESLLKQAIDEYSTGLDLLEDMETEVIRTRALFKKKNNLNERWYWQEIDRRNQEARKIRGIKYNAKMKSITHLTRSINFMDEIQSLEVRKDPKFINFQIRLFQVYVSTQYDMKNLKPCIPILERYVAINEKTKKDVWAYKYMASCYGFMEVTLTKYKQASLDLITDYKQKKNRAMLIAAELKFGIESPHYKRLKEVVELDEKKSERINDFK